jgi:hypothetical protein
MPSEIIENLWVGDAEDAKLWKGRILCVLEQRPIDEPIRAVSIPILKTASDGQIWTTNGGAPEVDMLNLALITDFINTSMTRGEKLLVHCAQSIERSPLAIVWYLHVIKQMPLNEAYDFVKKQHPRAQNRLSWINDGDCIIGNCKHLNSSALYQQT